MNEKQQQLTFDKGITNVPSDALCSDNCLSDSNNIVFMSGEHRPIQKPVEVVKYPEEMKGATLLYVHRVGQNAMYIVRLTSKALVWGNVVDGNLQKREELYSNTEDSLIVKSVGKTLVVTQYDAGIGYFTWNASKNSYTQLSGNMPDIKIKFQLEHFVEAGSVVQWAEKVVNVWSADDGEATINSHKAYDRLTQTTYVWHEVKKQNIFNDAVVGIIWNHLKEVKKARRFCFPFWVRYAIKLYDGSYTKISEPILMYPTVKKNFGAYITHNSAWNTADFPRPDYMSTEFGVTYNPYCAKMLFKVEADETELEEWKDIIEGVDVFVSEEVIPMNLNSNWFPVNPQDTSRGQYIWADHAGNTYYSEGLPNSGNGRWTTFLFCECYSEQQFTDKLMSASQFYQIMELRLGDLKKQGEQDSSTIMTDTTLENLTTNTRLDVDDYYTHTKVGAKTAMVYNGRLILGNLQRSIYEGGEHFISYKRSYSRQYDVYVTIDTADGEKVAHHSFSSDERLQYYFYYPDPRASKVDIYLGNVRIVSRVLQKHEYLNGAYFFAGLPDDVGEEETQMAQPADIDSSPEKLLNEIYVSEVNNPLVFRPAGDLIAGLGSIVGLATQTTALSQGQFGQYPLIVFASDGIYAASVANDGVFSAIHPMSREVCNNKNSITPTDAEVFFSSDKGLMMVYGNVVKHVSEQLDGDFVEMLSKSDTFIGYDYRDSLLWIVNKRSLDCYIYNKKTGTIHKSNFFGTPGGQTPSGGTYAFDGFVDVAETSIDEGEADDEAETNKINRILRGSDAAITSLKTPAETLPIFYSPRHDFLGCADWTASADMILYVSGTQYYTIFAQKSAISSHNYFIANNSYYQKTESNGVVDLVQIPSSDVAPFAYIYDSSSDDNKAILNKEFTNTEDAKSDIPSYITEVLYFRDENIVYDSANKRFYYKVTFVVINQSSQEVAFSLLYTAFANSNKYVDTNNNNHPLGSVFYLKSNNNDVYQWQNNDFSQTGSAGVLSDVVASGIDPNNITDGEYSREGLQQILNTKLMSGVTVTVSRNSSSIVYNNTTNQFVNKVVYSYIWRGNTCFDTGYYSVFENDSIYNDKSKNNLYIKDDLRYRWVDNNLALVTGGISSVVNDYPDTLMQKAGKNDGSVYSLLQRPQAKDDTNQYSGFMETRPMKLENALALKSIMQIRHILQMEGTMTMKIYASNNLKTDPNSWAELHSLRGTPWKYYKFRYDFKDMKATDRFAGTMLITQERRTNKLR